MTNPAFYVGSSFSVRDHFQQYSALYLLLSLFIAIAIIPPITGSHGSFASVDALESHIPQVNMFMSRPFDVFQYPSTSATTPGYHIFLAWILNMLGYTSVNERTLPLILINLTIGCVPVLVAWLIAKRLSGKPWHAMALVAPIAGSSYILSSASFVTTDDGAFAFYTLAMFLLLFHRHLRLALATTAAAAVAWRQLYFPIIGALALSVVDKPWKRLIAQLLEPRRLVGAIAICLPASVLIVIWAINWGGFVPPEFRARTSAEFRTAVPVQALALAGLYAIVFAFPASELAKSFDSMTWRRIIGISVIMALALWLVGPTTYDHSLPDERYGRWGSIIWTLAARTPHIGTHSFVVLGLTVLGIAALAAIMLHAFRENYFPAESLLLVFYLVGYCAQPLAWQRYVEPPILLTFATFTARLPKARPAFDLVPLSFALIYATITTLHNTEIVGGVNL